MLAWLGLGMQSTARLLGEVSVCPLGTSRHLARGDDNRLLLKRLPATGALLNALLVIHLWVLLLNLRQLLLNEVVVSGRLLRPTLNTA